MRSNNFATITLYLVIIVSVALISKLAYAQTTEAPALPALFYGKATVNGRDVPINSIVIAKIGNEKRGQLTVTTAGAYGQENTDSKLGVSGTRSSLGKDIEFYIKLPKLMEIKATQTSKWQSGETTKLDLTFVGEEIEDNSTEIIEEQFENKESFFYESLTAGKQLMILLNNPNIPIIRLQLITTKNLTNVTFEFESVENPNVPKLEGVYKYVSINAPKISDNSVKTAILRFKVPNRWFTNNSYDPNKVKLLRYNNNKWNELETVHEGSDSTDNYYRASTPGFSYFAIKAEKLQQTELPKKNDTRVDVDNVKINPIEKKSENKEQNTNKITGFAVGDIKPDYWMMVALISIGMLVGIILTYFFVIRKKTE